MTNDKDHQTPPCSPHNGAGDDQAVPGVDSPAERPMTEEQMHRIVVGALRSCVIEHGPITKGWIGSAAKRIVKGIINGQHGSGTETPPPAEERQAQASPDRRTHWE